MGELARRRSAQDVRVSRGQLVAGLVVGVLALLLAFGAGLTLGRSLGAPPVVQAGSGAELVDLLARVEASKDPRGGLSEITFPEALSGGAAPVEALDVAPGEGTPLSADEGVAAVVGAGEGSLPVASEPPPGRFTIRVHVLDSVDEAREVEGRLRDAGLPVWLGAERVEGAMRTLVQVGGYETEAEAEAARQGMTEAFTAAGLGEGEVLTRD